MASRTVLLGSLKSRVKGDHAYRSGLKVVDLLFYSIEPDNKHSDNAIVGKSGSNDLFAHVQETLAKKLFNFMKSNRYKLLIVRLLATLDMPLKENGSLAVV